MNAIAELKSMANDQSNRLLFMYLSERRDNNKPVVVDKILSGTRHKVPRNDVVHFAKSLDRMNLCNFVAGRRNFPSRVMFYFTPASIGRVALGQSEQLERLPQTTSAEIAGDTVREALDKQTPTAPPTTTEDLLFEVQKTALGTLFILPATATNEDKDKLIEYIQQMPLTRHA